MRNLLYTLTHSLDKLVGELFSAFPEWTISGSTDVIIISNNYTLSIFNVPDITNTSSIQTILNLHTTASIPQTGNYAQSYGIYVTASGDYSHAEGNFTIASGSYSHAEGIGTIASGSGQLVIGLFNSKGNSSSLFIIGNGGGRGSRADLALFNSQSIIFNYPLTGSVVSASFIGNLIGTSSFASILDGNIFRIISGSSLTFTSASAQTSSLSFSMAPNEIWRFEIFTSVQCSNTGGTKYAISCSVPVRFLEAWIDGAVNTTASFTKQRITNINTLQSVAMHGIATTPTDDFIWGTIMNFTSSAIVYLAIASGTAGQVTTLFPGTYMNANKIGNIT